MTFVMFLVTFLRYTLQLGWVWLQECAIYSNMFLLSFGISYALLRKDHVSVDILYKRMGSVTKAKLQLYCSLILFFPFTGTLFIISLPYVWQSWLLFEQSSQVGGLPIVFIAKSFLLVIPTLLFLQGLPLLWRSYSELYIKEKQIEINTSK